MIRSLNLEKKEIDRVMDIWMKSTLLAHNFISEDYWNRSYETVKDMYLPNSETYVYHENDDVYGFISIIESNYIGALFVDVKHQGKGIGKKLIDHVIHKYKELSLAVYSENLEAVNFYKKNAFEIVKEQENEETKHKEYIMVRK